jgi:NADH:ubiquinone oxidoreductase subunit 3 (subunit A)
MTLLLTPPIAFCVYLALGGLLVAGAGRMAAAAAPDADKAAAYASGEAATGMPAVPGYQPFFVIALFFAVLHLGVLVLGSGQPSAMMGIYLIGLILILIGLILG